MRIVSIPRDDEAFQRPLTEEQLKSMCTSGLGYGQRVEEIRELASGMFNNTYLICLPNRKVILRVGPAPEVCVFSNEQNLLRREQSIEPFLKSLSKLVPQTIHADFTRKLIDRDFVFQTFVEGELWDEIKNTLSPAQTSSLWKQLGSIARQIHDVRGKTFGFPPPQKQFLLGSDALINAVCDMSDDIVEIRIDPSGVADYLEMLEEGRAFLDEITHPRLVHGDLWPKNVLIKRDSGDCNIVGLLDCERAFWGDPMAEWIFHDGTCGASFWESYGDRPIGKSARFREHAYTGLYAVQLYLEAWRFKLDDESFRRPLAGATMGMRDLLKS